MSVEFKDSICVFIDVLGFTSMVRKRDKLIKEYVEKIQGFATNFDETKHSIKFMAVSDSLIFGMEIQEDLKETLITFRGMLELVCGIQFLLGGMGLWTRGGIASGQLAFVPSKNIIIGEAYLRAIEIEQMAGFPRVLLDLNIHKIFNFDSNSKMVKFVNKLNSGVEYTIKGDVIFNVESYKQELAADLVKDKPLFVDFATSFDIFDGQEGEPILCKELAKAFHTGLEYYPKYNWLKQYLICKLSSRDPKEINQAADKSLVILQKLT